MYSLVNTLNKKEKRCEYLVMCIHRVHIFCIQSRHRNSCKYNFQLCIFIVYIHAHFVKRYIIGLVQNNTYMYRHYLPMYNYIHLQTRIHDLQYYQLESHL